jgi:hypothetical protein
MRDSETVPMRESVITCPHCGVSKLETMPTDACQFYYECTSCGALLRPKPGHCCVFCSYGSVACPPKQEDVNDGNSNAACGPRFNTELRR